MGVDDPILCGFYFLARMAQLTQITHLHKLKAGRQAMLDGLQKVENRCIGLFSCGFGILSKKVEWSELSKVVRKTQFALFR